MISFYTQPWRHLGYICTSCRVLATPKYFYSQGFDKYSEAQKEKIIKIINDANTEISDYNISKAKLKKFSQWRSSKGQINTLSDLELVEGFTKKTSIKLYDSILEGPEKKEKRNNKIKGQILHPALNESVRKNCQSVLAVYINVNSVVWTLINRNDYTVTDWRYDPIEYPDGKKLQITDIYDIASSIVHRLPPADIYIMKAEATSLRAAGSDPNNAKAIAVNLQKAQMIAMIVAIINSSNIDFDDQAKEDIPKHKVYF
ncbi:transcription elongation factor, mitochondrial [Leguminivora glycinivorella]|uniref:transcription elongation factor, mitochondrial n=1 Tax=Leguminivora glycinivorella TaxID=1035111 RepID=UPI0020100FA4|nr:transcription elongation factor, mitochondrial [Leguminivora glycinivorella]